MKKTIIIVIIIWITALQIFAQNKSKPYGFWSANVEYLISSNNKNMKGNKPLFAGNGFNTGIGYRWGDRLGFASKASYISGQNSNSSIETFAKTLVSNPFTYKINGLQKNWSQMNLAIGPSIMIGKNHYRGEINAVGGIVLNKKTTISIDKYDGNLKLATVYNAEQKGIMPFWEIGARYWVAKLSKNIGLDLKGGFGSNGGTIGLSFRDIRGCYRCRCCRICPDGCPPPPKGGK